MQRRIVILAALVFGSGRWAAAENAAPVVTQALPAISEYAGAPAASTNLDSYFRDPDTTSLVRLNTVFGAVDVALYDRQKPITVANFLRYVNNGRYFATDSSGQVQGTFVHRSVPGFVIQGGGYIFVDNQTRIVQEYPKIQNEPGISNLRGTIAMAKLGGDPNSATSQWFINLGDNSANLDAQNGGFTVFGRVVNNGMVAIDQIGALPTVNASSPFDQLPVRNYDGQSAITAQNLVLITGISVTPSSAPLSYAAQSSDASIATATVSGTNLLVAGVAPGTATITAIATDLDGATISQSFPVTVQAAPGRLVNIATRLPVGTDDRVLIAGFIVRGGLSKRLIVRGIGPSTGVAGALADPVLELRDSAGDLVASNNDWGTNLNKQEIEDTGLAPTSPQEAAILTTVPSNDQGVAYTAVLRGAAGTTGIGVVEGYDLDAGAGSTILNISTRGQVGTGDNVLIGGFFVGGTESKPVLVRGIGPSLTAAGVTEALQNPRIELNDANGNVIDANDDWRMNPRASEISATGIAPTNDRESAVFQTLPPSSYTAVVRGVNDTTGIGSVEVYQLQ